MGLPHIYPGQRRTAPLNTISEQGETKENRCKIATRGPCSLSLRGENIKCLAYSRYTINGLVIIEPQGSDPSCNATTTIT